MAIISPQYGLYMSAFVGGVFGLMMFTMPMSFMKQYQLDTDSMNLMSKLMIGTIMQFWAMNLFMNVCVCTITARNGTEEQQATTALMMGLGSIISAIIQCASTPQWTELGVAASGIYFNVGLFALIAVVNFLGASFPPTIKMAPLSNPMYWGFVGMIGMYTMYMFTMFFAPDSLMDGYGVTLKGKPKAVLKLMFQFGLAPAFLSVILLFKGHLVTAGSLATYGIARYMCAILMGLMSMCVVMAAVWTCLNEDGKYDKIISGQYFNTFLWLVFFFLFYVPVARMDSAIGTRVVESVENIPYKGLNADQEAPGATL
jgi:hypothetical protein